MSSQIKNLKSQTTKEKIKHLSVLFFSLLLTLAVFSQISYGNAKPKDSKKCNSFIENCELKIENSASPSDWLYYKSNNDLSAYLGKKSSSLPTVRYQKGADYLEFSMTGVSSTTSVSLETDTKKPNEPTLFYRNILDGMDANYQITNVPFRVKEEIVLKETFPTSHVGKVEFLFSAETSAKPVKQKDGSIAFFGENGDYLFQLDKPFMIDANLNRSEAVTIEIIPNKTNQNRHRMSVLGHALNFQFAISNFQSITNDSIFKPFSSLKIDTWKFIENWPLKIENSAPQSYQITLTASSSWLNDPNTAYPVIIDPTITHNEDAEFDGQKNRIADSDTTTSTQLESSYPEATKDPYTVLLLHFNEANGTTAGIRDYASTTRVITANGNASTTSYVTQLGLGNSAALDGTGDYLSLPDSDDWAFGTGDFAIDVWVYLNSLPTAGNIKIFLGNGAGNPNEWFAGIVDTAGTKRLYFQAGSTQRYADQVLVTGSWHHYAWNRSSGMLSSYFDGKLIGSESTADSLNNTTAIDIGRRNDGVGAIDGSLDSLRIIKGRALTLEEIKAVASRRPYSVYTSSVLDASASVQWDTLNWTEGGVNTGDGETPYSTNSLVAQWNFNETSGTTATSSTSGSCQTCAGTLNGFSYTASQDQAATATGWTANNKKWGAGGLMISGVATADLVSLADPASNVLDPNSADLTIETWINTSDTSAEIFSNNNANGAACANNGYYLGIDANGYPVFYLDTNGATAGCDAQISSSIATKVNDSKWHHLVISVTRGASAVMYLDGAQIGSDTSVTSYSAITVTGAVYFGGSAGGLDAILDSARYYSRALSAAEILSNYNAGNIEIQTRAGATSDPNDGTWEAWKPTTGETQLLSMDSDAANWRSDIMASTTIATSTETVIKAEGTGSLKIRTGMASTTAGAVALWHFEETGTTTGTYLYDETANNNDATTTGTTVVDGIFGKARRFNSGDVIEVSALASVYELTQGTVMFWLKIPTPQNGQKKIFGVAQGLSYPNGDEWEIDYGGPDRGSRIEVAVINSGSAIVDATTPNGSIKEGIWQHIAVVSDQTNPIKIYIDGVDQSLGGTTADKFFVNAVDANNMTIGGLRRDTLTAQGNQIIDEFVISNRALSADEIAETYRMGANHHLTRQVSAVDLSGANKLAFNVASDRPGTYLETMLGESDYANYELASSTLALSTNTVLYIKGDEIASSTSIKDSSFSGKAITANGNARTAGGGKIGNSVYFDGTGDYLTVPDSDDWNFGSGDFSVDFWTKFDGTGYSGYETFFMHGVQVGGNWYYLQWTNSGGEKLRFYTHTGGPAIIQHDVSWTRSLNTWYHVALVRSGNNFTTFVNGLPLGTTADSDSIGNYTGNFAVGENTNGPDSYFGGLIDEFRILKGAALSADQIRQAYEYGLRTHPITIDFGATLQTSDLISSATDYNFILTATTSGLSATTSGLYLGDKIIIKENLGGTEYTAQGTVNAINTATGAITVPSWDTGSTFPSGNGYSPNATVFKWQREYFDLTGAATTTRDAITNLTLRPTNGAGGRTIYLDDFRYNTNYLTASSSSAITSGNNRYLQYRAIFSSADTFVSPFLSAFNTLYTALANSFPSLIGVSGGGFLSF